MESQQISERLTALEEKLSKVQNCGNNIPDFYRDYLDSRIKDIRKKEVSISNTGDSFIFITDIHDQNNLYSPFLAKEIMDKTDIHMLVYGGDYINEPQSKETALHNMYSKITKSRVCDDAIFMRGNHDSNPYGIGRVKESEYYAVADKYIEKYIDTEKQTYFCKDNPSQKIRYFITDCGDEGDIDDIQRDWISAKAEELTSDWTIIVFAHLGICPMSKTDRTKVKDYRSLKTIRAALENAKATVACVVCGHTHIDLCDTIGKYPIICTTCDAHGMQANSASSDARDVGTINEQAFDVFSVDTANKKIYVTRIGGGEKDVTAGTDYTLNDREFSYKS